MERTLEIQWMVNGYGGYTVHRYSIFLPSQAVLLYAVSLLAWAAIMWTLYKAGKHG